MIYDAQNLYSDAQALTATAASTNVIDHGSDRDIGIGEPLVVVLTLDAAADDGDANETYTAVLQTDTVEGFGSPTQVGATVTITRGDPIGTRYLIHVPADQSMERFSRINYTLGGTTPSVTVTAALIPLKNLENFVAHPDNITITVN